MHLRIVLTLLAKHVNHLTHNVLRLLRRPLRNAYHRLIARLATLQLLLRHHDVVYEDVTLGNQEGIVLLHLQASHGLVHLVRDDLRHHCLLDVVLAAGHERHFHTVAVQRKHRVTLRHEDGLATIVGHKRVLAVGLADKRAFLHLSLGVQTVLRVRHLREEVVPCHFFHGLHS